MSHRVAVLFVFLISVAGGAGNPAACWGQSLGAADRPTRMGGLNFTVGLPTGAFADNVEGTGVGGTFFVGTQLGRSPVVVGLDLGFLVYGRNESTVPFSTTVPIRVELVTTNSIFQPHAVLRLQPQDGALRPYVEAVGGFKYLFTETTVRDRRRDDEDRDLAGETNFDDFAWSGGGGLGLDYVVYRPGRAVQTMSNVRGVALHVGGQYVFGQEAEYVAEGPIEDRNGNNVIDEGELDLRRSPTHLVLLKLGITAYF